MCNVKALVQMMYAQKMITQSVLGTFSSLFGFSGSLLLCLGHSFWHCFLLLSEKKYLTSKLHHTQPAPTTVEHGKVLKLNIFKYTYQGERLKRGQKIQL